jgi:hypothetical protein
VKVRTRRPDLFVFALLPSCADAMRTEKESALAGIGTAGSGAASRDADHTAPAARNSRYTISRNGVLLLSLPLSPEPSEKVVMRPTGFITLQSAGSQTKGNIQADSSFLPSACRARFSDEGASRRDTRKLRNIRLDRVMAYDKDQQQDFRQLSVVAKRLTAHLPVVADFTEGEI